MKLVYVTHVGFIATLCLVVVHVIYSRHTLLAIDNVYAITDQRRNVLFIIVDELRPQLGAYEGPDYGAPRDRHKMQTPNIDRLASRSLVLNRAYAQYSLFGPSRASLMVSRRPDVTKVYKNHMNSIRNFTGLVQYFRQGGYHTIGAGKVFHLRQHSARDWSEPFAHLLKTPYNTTNYNWHAVDSSNSDDLPDADTVDFAIDKLIELSRRPKPSDPFFMAVGLNKPHAPHACPQKYFKRYALERGQFLINKTWQSPLYRPYTNMLPFANDTDNSQLERIPEQALKELRRAYFACVSYVDDLIGALLRAVERHGLDESTVVVLLADHGIHLGDNDVYGKYTNHEVATHVPLILRVPGLTDGGSHSRSLVELVDVFPTLVEAVGLKPIPRCPRRSTDVTLCTDGQSFMALTTNATKTIKEAVFSQVARGKDIMEYSIRTVRYRYIDYATLNTTEMTETGRTHWSISLHYTILERQLYDLELDPTESRNIINSKDCADIVKELRSKLLRKFRYVHDFPEDIYMSISGNNYKI